MFRIMDWKTAMFLTNENKFSYKLSDAKQFHEKDEAVSFLEQNNREINDFRIVKRVEKQKEKSDKE